MGWPFEAKVESGETKQTILFLVENFSADQYLAEDSSGIWR